MRDNSLIDELKAFSANCMPEGDDVAGWVRGEKVEVYVRLRWGSAGSKGRRRIFEIADVVMNDDHVGHGLFSRFLDACEELFKDLPIKVENVTSKNRAAFLSCRGYQPISAGMPVTSWQREP